MAWKRTVALAVLLTALNGSAYAQSASLPETQVYRIWPARAPGAPDDSPAETPSLMIVRPPPGLANGTAVVIAPGGAYVGLARTLEGSGPAYWFASRGVTAFVLTYRVGKTAKLPTPLFDGARAIRYVRAHAADWSIDPGRIGMMGFSAGGHLAATTAVDATAGVPDAADPIERASSRPDFLILGYPWLEGMQLRPDGGSSYCDFALRTGSACQPKDYAQFKPLAHVSANTPPTFIYHTADDGLVPAEGSVSFFLALRAHSVPAEMHIFQSGPHGTGFGGSSPSLGLWPDLMQEWMRARGLLPVAVPKSPR